MILWLAMRATLRNRLIFLCNIAVILGVLVPLLTMAGLRSGLHEALIAQLSQDADIRAVHVRADRSLDADTLSEIAGWPETGFVVPRSRAIANVVQVRSTSARRIENATLVPSGAGDPALPVGATPVSGLSVYATAGLTGPMGLAPGDRLQLVARIATRPEVLALDLTVLGQVPPSTIGGSRLLATPELLDLVESYYEGYAVPQHGVMQGRDPADRIPVAEGVRLYATDLTTVAPLAAKLEATLGLEATSQADEIVARFALSRALRTLLALIAGIGFTGMAAALTFVFWAEVEQNRRDYGVLGLMGLGTRAQAGVIYGRALILGLIAGALSIGGYILAALLISRLLPDGLFGGRRPVALDLTTAAAIMGTASLVLLLAATLAGSRLRRIDPSALFRGI